MAPPSGQPANPPIHQWLDRERNRPIDEEVKDSAIESPKQDVSRPIHPRGSEPINHIAESGHPPDQ